MTPSRTYFTLTTAFFLVLLFINSTPDVKPSVKRIHDGLASFRAQGQLFVETFPPLTFLLTTPQSGQKIISFFVGLAVLGFLLCFQATSVSSMLIPFPFPGSRNTHLSTTHTVLFESN